MTQEIPNAACRSFLDLTKEIGMALARSKTHAKATHERFNVFSTLLKESDEVRLHTRFIHCLLDPHGNHDCGSLFLDLFFETITPLGVVNHAGDKVDLKKLSQSSSWAVHKEASRSPHGQIDLLLERPGFGIAIENKIFAGEQPEQLVRYGKYLHGRHGDSFILLYLTLDGKQACTTGDHQCYRISYKEHILAWLDLCLRETYHIIPVNQALIQYRAVIRRLTHQALENEYMKPVIDFIRENPEIIRFNDAVQEAVRQASIQAWERLKERIKSTFGSDYEIAFQQERNWGSNSNAEPAMILRAHAGSGLHHIDLPVWIEPDFINDKCLGIGICTDGLDLSPSVNGIFDRIRAFMEGLPRHGFHCPPNGKPRYPIGWRNLIQGSYAEQSAQILSDAKIDSICEDIRDYLDQLTRAYNDVEFESNISPSPIP